MSNKIEKGKFEKEEKPQAEVEQRKKNIEKELYGHYKKVQYGVEALRQVRQGKVNFDEAEREAESKIIDRKKLMKDIKDNVEKKE